MKVRTVCRRAAVLTAGVAAVALPAWAVPTLPSINTNNIVNITDPPYSAVAGGVITNTTAIQNAINAAAAGGTTNGLSGGTVEIPSGTFLSGPLTLKSHLNLRLDSGTTLIFLPETKYPGATGSPVNPITASSLTDLEISGPGTIDGNGSSWWSSGAQNPPYMIYFTKCYRLLIQEVTLQNSPKMHISIKNGAGNITIQGITINSPGTSPNTDGIDLIGTNCLVQNCTINAGDDNIALGSSSSGAISSDTIITNCTFGVGHGVSVGSNTAGGVSNLTVINCTFNGTDYGIRMKSDNATSGSTGAGGIAQNLSYLNIGMTNIKKGVIVIYSYYSEYGTPTSITPSTAATQTVGSVILPVWRNITISNLTATTASGAIAGIIWGRIEAPVTNILLSQVSINASKTFQVYNAQGIQFVDSQVTVPSGNKTYTLFNADLTLSNSAPGAALVTIDGLTSTNSLALYNAPASMTASDAFGADPITLSGSLLTISNSLSLPPSSTINFTVGSSDTRLITTGNLTLNGTLNVTNGDGFSPGTYTLCSYNGALGGTQVLGATPDGFGYTYALDTSTPLQVNLVVSNSTPPPPPPAPPVFGSIARSAGSLVIAGSGGTTNGTYFVLTSTNLSLPMSQWTPIATNQFDASGNFSFTNGIAPDSLQLYYLLLLQYP